MKKNNSLNGGKMLKRSVSPDSPFTGISGKRRIYDVLTIVALLLFISGVTQADILMVPSQYPTIQDGLNAALEGDTVLVAHGTYYEHIIWPSIDGIHLISEAGAEQTVIDGEYTGRVITIDSGVSLNTEIRGFTIQHGNASNNTGNGILCELSSPTITENIITNNNGGKGCGIYCHWSNPLIKNNQIINNQGYYGVGIGLRFSDPLIIGNIITGNYSPGGWAAGIDCYDASPIIRDNIISNNTSWYNGGAIYCTRSHGIIQFNDIYANVSLFLTTGGIFCYDSPDLRINFNNIVGNNYGVWNHGSGSSLNAKYNWWGDPSGPGGAGPGIGDKVNNTGVIYTPWLQELAPPLPVVSLPICYGAAGETISIPVMVSELLTGFGIVSAEFDMTYDSDILTGMDVDTSGTLLSGTDWDWEYNVTPGQFSVTIAGTDTLAGSGTLINLIFVVAPDAEIGEESPLNFVDFIYNQGEPPVYTQNGVFIVRDIFGAIEGTVTDSATGEPIAGALVTAHSTHPCCDTTNAVGHYLMSEVFPDTYNMTVIAFGYNQSDTTGIVAFPGDTTYVNFTMLHPEIAVDPDIFDVTLCVDSTLNIPLYITNNGNGPLEFNIEIAARELKTTLNREILAKDRVKSQPGPDTFCRIPTNWTPDSYTSRDAGDIIESHPSLGHPSGFEWDGTYFWQGNWGGSVVKLDSSFNVIASYPACGNPDMPPMGLAWHNGYLYQGCYTENNVYKIDVSDGYYPVDTINVPGAGGLLGVEWVDDHLWVTDDFTQLIYECDSLGNMINSWLSLDTVPFGLSYNPYFDIIFLNGWSGGNIYTIDPYTGEINFVFSTPGTSGAFSCTGSSFDNRYPVYLWIAHQNDRMLYLTDTGYELYISAIPISGTVLAGNTFEVTIHFDTYGLPPNSTYTTSILIHNNSVNSQIDIPVTLHTTLVGVDDDTPQVPIVFALSQNYPNPVSEITSISYQLPKKSEVSLKIYDVRGRFVCQLEDGIKEPGFHSVSWDTRDNNGKKVGAGIYFYRLESSNYKAVKKFILLR